MAKLNAALLRSARQVRKLSLEEVAAHTKIAEGRLQIFESGDREPSYKQLLKLSDLYNAHFYDFYGDKPLKLEEVLLDFRKSNPTTAKLSPKGLSRLWQVKRRAEFTDALLDALGDSAPPRSVLHRLTNRKYPDATALRATFDAWHEDRKKKLKFTGSPEESFFRYLRLFLEARSCSTVANSAPEQDYLGFYDKLSAKSRVVFVNSNIKFQKRKLFTLCHEMAHFVYDAEGVSNPFAHAQNDMERQCNAFAAEFIAPEYLVYRVVEQSGISPLRDPESLIERVSRETLLSRQAAAMRLADLAVITKKSSNDFFSKVSRSKTTLEYEVKSPPPKAIGRAAAIGKKLSEVGVHSAYVAGVALNRKLIDSIDVQRGLGISESLQQSVLDLAKRRYEASSE